MALLRKVLAILSVANAVFALPSLAGDDIVPGKYIIKLKSGILLEEHLAWASNVLAQSPTRRNDHIGITHQYTVESLNAYAGEFDDETITQIRNSEDVDMVEPETVWRLYQVNPSELTTQAGAPWGLGSLSHKQANTDEYIYDPRGGNGTYAYVVDTGLLTTHVEFGNRGSLAYNAVPGSTSDDNVGHGTHVAGTIASQTYGVAKEATIISVKVLDSELGLGSQVMDGYAWAVNNITAEGRQASSVVSLSIGGPFSQTFNDMVEAAYGAGITTVVAAGNYGQLANLTSPASAPNAITVGAIAANLTRPTWSDYGDTIDMFAAGVDVVSTWIGSNTATNNISGTSMSTPHISGLVLYLKSIMSDLDSPDAVTKKINDLATRDLVQNSGSGSPNVIAYNGNGA